MAESLSLLGSVELPETHTLFLGPTETYWCVCLGKIIKPTTPRMVNSLSWQSMEKVCKYDRNAIE